jgi:preprotein translocase subunit YajC
MGNARGVAISSRSRRHLFDVDHVRADDHHPESQKRKKLETFVASLKRGDEVVLTSGIFGKIQAIEERYIQLEIADKVRIRVLKQSVTGAAQLFLAGEQKTTEADKSKSE